MTKIEGSGSRIRIRIPWSAAWIRGSGSGSTPKSHGSATLRDFHAMVIEEFREERIHFLKKKHNIFLVEGGGEGFGYQEWLILYYYQI
jgi:hypothetical protein